MHDALVPLISIWNVGLSSSFSLWQSILFYVPGKNKSVFDFVHQDVITFILRLVWIMNLILIGKTLYAHSIPSFLFTVCQRCSPICCIFLDATKETHTVDRYQSPSSLTRPNDNPSTVSTPTTPPHAVPPFVSFFSAISSSVVPLSHLIPLLYRERHDALMGTFYENAWKTP